jgi:tetratricopeptide (TPR) repeat protein
MAHEHIVYMMLVDSAARTGDGDAIRNFAPRLEELALRDDHQPYLAVAHRAWGIAHRLAGDHRAAEERLQKALDIFQALGTRWQIGCTCYELGELALAKTDGAAAQDFFTQAQVLFEELGAKPDLEKTAVHLAALE